MTFSLSNSSLSRRVTFMIFFSTVGFAIILTFFFTTHKGKSDQANIQTVQNLVNIAALAKLRAQEQINKGKSVDDEWLERHLSDELDVNAAFFIEENKVVASYNPFGLPKIPLVKQELLKELNLAGPETQFLQVKGFILVICKITNSDQTNDYLVLAYNPMAGYHFFNDILEMLVLAFIFFYFYVLREVRNTIIVPIEHLVRVMQEVSQTRNYKLRAEVALKDELGYLTATFNVMLSTIQSYINYKLAAEKKITKLMAKIFPTYVLEKMNAGEVVNRKYHKASVMFVDIVNFTQICEELSIKSLESMLTEYYVELDKLVEKHQLQKIKTIGDCYMATSRVEVKDQKHELLRLLKTALDIVEMCGERTFGNGKTIGVRIGIAYDEIFAGIIGEDKLFFDVWGRAVNLAARLEDKAGANEVVVSSNVYTETKEYCEYEDLGLLSLEGHGVQEQHIYKLKQFTRTDYVSNDSSQDDLSEQDD